MGLSAVVPRAHCIGRLGIPFDDRQGRVSALNHKPVLGVGSYSSADFTTEFSYRGHSLLLYGYSEEDERDPGRRDLMRDRESRRALRSVFSIESECVSSTHAKNTLEHNCARLAVAHFGRSKRTTGSAISTT